jgi:hypothetical protein
VARPNHTTGAGEINTRLTADLVPTYAKQVWRAAAPEESLPGESELPIVVYTANADYTGSTDDYLVGNLEVVVFVIRHAKANPAQSDTVVGRIIGDTTTHGLYRWAPTISGITASPLDLEDSGDTQYDVNYVADVLRFTNLQSGDS